MQFWGQKVTVTRSNKAHTRNALYSDQWMNCSSNCIVCWPSWPYIFLLMTYLGTVVVIPMTYICLMTLNLAVTNLKCPSASSATFNFRTLQSLFYFVHHGGKGHFKPKAGRKCFDVMTIDCSVKRDDRPWSYLLWEWALTERVRQWRTSTEKNRCSFLLHFERHKSNTTVNVSNLVF